MPAPTQPPLPAAVAPYDPQLGEWAHRRLLEADWNRIQPIAPATLEGHPERGRIAAMLAVAQQQLGNRDAARALSQQALAWGLPREGLAACLLAGMRHTLGRASAFSGRERHAEKHFERALLGVRMSSEVRRLTRARIDRVADDLADARAAAALLRKQGTEPAAVKAPAWLVGLAARCLQAPDLHDSVDEAMDRTLSLPDDRVQFLMLLAESMLARGDRMTALHFLNSARWFVAEVGAELRAELMQRMVAFGEADRAVDVGLEAALEAAAGAGVSASATAAVLAAYRRMRDAAHERHEHGHELLLAWMAPRIGRMKELAAGRKLTLVEVGTTREDVPGQGSTLKLAEFCVRNGLHFVTIDMDPHNGRMARATFERIGASGFEAVTAKGEDYLRDHPGPLDLVFLDAYDFDHGKHSELRQSRYEKYLGARIDERACHQMHLDCAQSCSRKLWEHGVVCIDDTWLERDAWTAKGTLAMPFLLEQGFRVFDARNRAALLVRQNRSL